MPRQYAPCDYVTAVYPAWAYCGRPVEIRAQDRGGLVRCPEHAARLPYWPGAEANTPSRTPYKPGAEANTDPATPLPLPQAKPESPAPCPGTPKRACLNPGPLAEAGDLQPSLFGHGGPL